MFKKLCIVFLFIAITLGITSNCIMAKIADKQIAIKDSREDDKKAIKEIFDILKEVKSLEEVSEADREKINQNLGIDFQAAINIEKKGYSLFDSLNISRVIKNYGYSIDNIEVLLANNRDITSLEKELLELENIFKTEKVPDDYINEFKKLLVDGFSVKEICSAYSIAKPLSVRIERVIKKDNNEKSSKRLDKILGKYTEIEAKIIKNISDIYFIDIKELIKISEEQKLSISEMQSKIISNEAEKNTLYGIDVQSNSTTSDTGGTGNKLDFSKYFNAPFIYERD